MAEAPPKSTGAPLPAGEDAPRPTRRALALGVLAGGCAVAAAATVPVAAFVAAPLRGEAGAARWVRTVPLARLRENEAERVAIVDDRRDAWTIERVELGSVWLVKRGDKVTAFSAVCPHLGCSVNAVAGAGGFSCPCHTSAFDPDGRRKSGPSPRDMDTLATRIEDGVVAVDFQRFRIGVPDKVQA